MGEEQPKVKVDWVQAAAGALTAITSAVLLSTVGVAGTLIGVAAGSVLGTVGNSVYSHYLRMSKERVEAAKMRADARVKAAAQRAARARARASASGPADPRVRRAEHDLEEAREEQVVAEEEARPSWREVVSELPWRRVLAVSGAVFVVALGAILTFEAITGRAISTYTGGSDENTRVSIPGVGSGQSGDQKPGDRGPQPDSPTGDQSDQPDQEPTPGAPTPTDDATEPAPTDEPTQTDAPTEPEPSVSEDPEEAPTPSEPPASLPASP